MAEIIEAKRARIEAKRQRRAQRERELAEATLAASARLGSKRYGVIYADPPWRFEPYSRDTGMDRAADNHYPTMLLDQIKALKIPAAKHCVLFLWATAPMFPQALEVMVHWGFTYKTQGMWPKDRIGLGYWLRNQHEPFVIATRGKVPAPAPGQAFPSVFFAPRGKHSAKPDAVAEMIETLYPNVPKLELFARRPRPGWDCWGNEVEITNIRRSTRVLPDLDFDVAAE